MVWCAACRCRGRRWRQRCDGTGPNPSAGGSRSGSRRRPRTARPRCRHGRSPRYGAPDRRAIAHGREGEHRDAAALPLDLEMAELVRVPSTKLPSDRAHRSSGSRVRKMFTSRAQWLKVLSVWLTNALVLPAACTSSSSSNTTYACGSRIWPETSMIGACGFRNRRPVPSPGPRRRGCRPRPRTRWDDCRSPRTRCPGPSVPLRAPRRYRSRWRKPTAANAMITPTRLVSARSRVDRVNGDRTVARAPARSVGSDGTWASLDRRRPGRGALPLATTVRYERKPHSPDAR